MATVPQVHPLWLAEIRDGDVYAGRVVAWQVQDGTARPTATPVVAFTTPDGMVLETTAPRGPLVYLGDTRDEAVAAAHRAASPIPGDPPRGPGHPPLPDDEDDERRPPDPRGRVLTLRRLSADEPAAQESGPAERHLHRHDR
jgi:hypothetical protein